MDITQISIIHHVLIVLALLWGLSSLSLVHPVLYLIAFIYLYKVQDFYVWRLREKVRLDERKQANQKRLLCDSESVRWLNYAVKKIWPICMEEIASQKFLLPVVPWFLDKYKPWTAEEAMVENLCLGSNPPMFTEIRVLGQCSDDDHLVMELGMNFLSADDMTGVLAVKLRKILGFGIRAKLNVTGLHIEGKVLVGVKFLREWPFLGRLRVCFVESPYFAMNLKPIFNYGLDVTVVPGIAGWMDKLLTSALKQTLVEPNMLVVDVEKFASEPAENWFGVDERDPIAYAKLEMIEASDMKPSDLNGLSDPYVKGQLGTYKFRTKIQKKTLSPKWHDEFKIPIYSWEVPNALILEVLDKDYYFDDTLGDCSIDISNLRGGRRHDMWLPLQNIKMGRLHLAITILDASADGKSGNTSSSSSETIPSLEKLLDNEDFLLEPIGKITRPGPKTRKNGNSSISNIVSNRSGHSSSFEKPEGDITKPAGAFQRSLRKIRSVFHFRKEIIGESKAEESTSLERETRVNKHRQE
ncbi:hypothetical protein GIB67_000670 [Kingdonia uniflora]|uniref:C2 domain-containing protein n=1 Tax=Kingdonia uniflora TaxID=39325 RepID=A0A7J7ND37_9MAGN|nr:hypothetical protein GIB67_000670 [Kingdonia uniflora]